MVTKVVSLTTSFQNLYMSIENKTLAGAAWQGVLLTSYLWPFAHYRFRHYSCSTLCAVAVFHRLHANVCQLSHCRRCSGFTLSIMARFPRLFFYYLPDVITALGLLSMLWPYFNAYEELCWADVTLFAVRTTLYWLDWFGTEPYVLLIIMMVKMIIMTVYLIIMIPVVMTVVYIFNWCD